MKKYLSILILIVFFSSYAQLQNVNPDPTGEPWMVGGLRIPSEEELAKIPVVELSQLDLQRSVSSLPSSLDNTTQPYFRPVFNQSDGSCSQSSGVAYNFTYEINRERNLPADVSYNQYPSHYTYNFLNDGNGNNGSWYVDGWDIIKANGCPDIPTYGNSLDALGDKGWMSGYDKYESSMNNRVKEYFAIDVSNAAGLETLKHWMYDHLEDAATGSLVNFAAGIDNAGYNDTTDASGNLIITSWGYIANHAMTFAGWDDNIGYDYNGDGQITNDIDITGDGIVDMRDWERGALLMVNSWGTSWGNYGKAYVMYRLLALSMAEGGIVGKKVFAVRAKTSQTSQLKMRIKMNHNNRKMIKIMAGISGVNNNTPEHTLEFPLFNKQGGPYPMQGNGNYYVEISLDISPLLSYVDPNTPANYYLIVNEDDPNGDGSGIIKDFAIVDNNGQVTTCSQHNVSINNNDDTILSVSATIDYDKPQIDTNSLPVANPGTPYSYALSASGGSPGYMWKVLQHYEESSVSDAFPAITSNPLTFTNEDDGYAEQSIDFDFPFYGENYNQLYISTDGSIRFEPGFEYIRSEATIKNYKIISIFASDLKIFPADGDAVYYEGDANHATFRWKTSIFGDQSANVDVALTLYPNGDIKFFYGNDITTGLDWAAGISNGEGSTKYVSISGDFDPQNQAFVFHPDPYPAGMFISEDGVFQGTTPNVENTWAIDFQVTDNNNISTIKTLDFITQIGDIATQQNFNSLKVYPNPVNDRATFSYELKHSGKVSLVLYDLSGKPLETLLEKQQKAGIYRIIWQQHLPRGIYIYKLTTEDGTTAGKLLVK